MDLVTIFCHVDDFCKPYIEEMKSRSLPLMEGSNGNRSHRMALSEIMTVLIYYGATSNCFKTFKAFYHHTRSELKSAFPKLVSYTRMIELKAQIQLPLSMFLLSRLGQCTGISFADSTKIEACHIKRASSHKTLKQISARGKTGDGWFYGSKLHFVINHLGDLISFFVTPGNFADNNFFVIQQLTKNLFGKLFADAGYIISKEQWRDLYEQGLQIIYGLRSNMKQRFLPIPMVDAILYGKRPCMAEGFLSILKDRMSLQYTKHRSIYGFVCNALFMLIAYQLRPNKPTVKNALLPAF